VDVLSFVGALRRNDKTRVAEQENRQKREGKEGKKVTARKRERGEDNNNDDDDDDHRLVATVAGNAGLYTYKAL